MPTHTRRAHKATITIILQLLAIQPLTAVLVLAAPNFSRSAGAVEDAVQVGGDDFVVVRELAVDHSALGPRDTGVSDEDVEAAIEIAHVGLHDLFDIFFACHVALVCFACSAGNISNTMTMAMAIAMVAKNSHFTPKSSAICSAFSSAFLLELYQIATLAPCSASARATCKPIPAPAPETIAVLCFSEKRPFMLSSLGAVVL